MPEDDKTPKPHDLAAAGMVDTLSMYAFELDQDVVDTALGNTQDAAYGAGNVGNATMQPGPFQPPGNGSPFPGGQFPGGPGTNT